MRIGVDLDGVIYNSENWFMAMAEFYDIQGHQIIIITSRGKIFNEHIKLTAKKLKKDKIIFDELYFSKSSKLSLCQEKNIYVMIDDSFQIVDELAKNNIKCIQFKADQTKQAEHQNVKIAYNWGEVIRLFQN